MCNTSLARGYSSNNNQLCAANEQFCANRSAVTTSTSCSSANSNHRVSFAAPLVAEVRLRPKTLSEDVPSLYYHPSELSRFRRQFAAVRAAERKRREAAENLLHEGQQEQEPSVLQKFATFIATTLNEECASTRTSQSSKTGDSDSGTRPPLQLDLLYAWDLGMVAASF